MNVQITETIHTLHTLYLNINKPDSNGLNKFCRGFQVKISVKVAYFHGLNVEHVLAQGLVKLHLCLVKLEIQPGEA